MEGRLRLAEKERQRGKGKVAASNNPTEPSNEELELLEAQANANMAALLEEEKNQKVIEYVHIDMAFLANSFVVLLTPYGTYTICITTVANTPHSSLHFQLLKQS